MTRLASWGRVTQLDEMCVVMTVRAACPDALYHLPCSGAAQQRASGKSSSCCCAVIVCVVQATQTMDMAGIPSVYLSSV
jgi:hypothetical protein